VSIETDPLLIPYLERPELLPHLVEVWGIFWRLSRRRPAGFGIGAIPMSEFQSYCATFGVDDIEQREWLFVRVDALDAAYLEHVHNQQNEKKGI